MPTEHHKKTMAERVSNGIHHLGEMLSIPTYDALDAYHPDPDREENHAVKHAQSATMQKIAHTAGQLVSIPKQEAIDACVNAGNHPSHNSDHDQQPRSLPERISSGAHHMGEMLSVPTYEVIDAYAHVPHHVHAAPRINKKSGNVQKMCRAVGAMLSVPICEAAETCGGGSHRGY